MAALRQAHEHLRRSMLYKYKSLHGNNFDHVKEILRDNKIFCPKPSQLNDIEECKPTLTIGDITDKTYRPKIEAWVRRCVAHRTPIPTELEIQEELAGLTQSHLEELLRQSTIDYNDAVNERYRIISLTGNYFNQHLWTKYAEDYTGVCLGFYVDPEWGCAYAVNYSDEERKIDVTEESDLEHLIQTGLIKRTEWAAEREYRLIFAEPPVDDGPVLIDQKYLFKPYIFQALIFGYKVDNKKKSELIALAESKKTEIICYIATPNNDSSITLTKIKK